MDLRKSFEFFQRIQCSFSLPVCEKVFPECPGHYWYKWETSDSNVIYFISRLDDRNKHRFLEYFRREFEGEEEEELGVVG